MQSKLYAIAVILAGLVVISILFVIDSSKKNNIANVGSVFNSSQAYLLPISEPSYFPIYNSNSPRPIIDGKAALVYDTRSGRLLFDKNTRLKLPIASLTKILSAVIVLENLDSKEVVTVSRETLKVDTEKQSLYLGEQITVENLLKLMLIESSNDAAYTLAWYANSTGMNFVDKMNEKAASLNMLDSKFLDPAGLNDDAYSTPDDLVKLVKYSLKYDKIWAILSEKSIIVRSVDSKIEHKVENTDQLLGVIPDIFGGKTGNTDGALGCMILVVDIPGKNDKLISIVLGSKMRFEDTKKLIDWVKESYRWD